MTMATTIVDWTHKIVWIKEEWLNPGEPKIPYVVLEDRDENILMQPVEQYFRLYYPNQFFVPVEVVRKEWVFIPEEEEGVNNNG